MLRKKQWQILPQADQDTLKKLEGFSPIVAQLLANRGLTDVVVANHFLNVDQDFLAHDPYSFLDMEEACQLIIKHVKAKNKIAIAGDYDADGVTASAVLTETLNTLKAETEVWIPSRMRDGYGLNNRIIDEIATSGAKLIITVDNGIRSKEEVRHAKSLGMDVIITDHHTIGEKDELPDCLIINPIIAREHYPFRFLAGVGVAYKLACTIINLTKLEDKDKNTLRRRILDLVAIGTVADCVSLLDENRHLVREGLKEINRSPRPGISALVNISQIKAPINEWHIGWQIAPRLNVAGRLAHANSAYQLLITKDPEEANALAIKLNEQNVIRQSETEKIVDYCHELIETEMMDDKILVLISPDIADPAEDAWFEGVIGLVAGKLAERYHKPTLVICQSDGNIKGSGRSVGDYSIIAALEEAKEYLIRFGGHKAACGFSVKDVDSLSDFAEAIRTIGQRDLTDEILVPKLRIEAVLEHDQINRELVESLIQFSPFGQNNPIPIFASYDLTIHDIVHMGFDNQHIKFRLGSFWAISFGGSARWQEFNLSDKVNVAYTLEINDFNNHKSVQMKIVDLVKVE